MPLVVLNGPKIAAGESLSDGIDCTGGQLVRLTMPTGWTAAPLTFQISSDNVFFNDLFGLDGYEVSIKAVVPGSGVILPADLGRAIAWIRFRSGSRAAPVAQEADRDFAVAIEAEAGSAAALGSHRRK